MRACVGGGGGESVEDECFMTTLFPSFSFRVPFTSFFLLTYQKTKTKVSQKEEECKCTCDKHTHKKKADVLFFLSISLFYRFIFPPLFETCCPQKHALTNIYMLLLNIIRSVFFLATHLFV